jgi:hypothetical protein
VAPWYKTYKYVNNVFTGDSTQKPRVAKEAPVRDAPAPLADDLPPSANDVAPVAAPNNPARVEKQEVGSITPKIRGLTIASEGPANIKEPTEESPVVWTPEKAEIESVSEEIAEELGPGLLLWPPEPSEPDSEAVNSKVTTPPLSAVEPPLTPPEILPTQEIGKEIIPESNVVVLVPISEEPPRSPPIPIPEVNLEIEERIVTPPAPLSKVGVSVAIAEPLPILEEDVLLSPVIASPPVMNVIPEEPSAKISPAIASPQLTDIVPLLDSISKGPSLAGVDMGVAMLQSESGGVPSGILKPAGYAVAGLTAMATAAGIVWGYDKLIDFLYSRKDGRKNPKARPAKHRQHAREWRPYSEGF